MEMERLVLPPRSVVLGSAELVRVPGASVPHTVVRISLPRCARPTGRRDTVTLFCRVTRHCAKRWRHREHSPGLEAVTSFYRRRRRRSASPGDLAPVCVASERPARTEVRGRVTPGPTPAILPRGPQHKTALQRPRHIDLGSCVGWRGGDGLR